MNILFYGDNLHVLRNEISSDSVDLVYLDPPFNSQRSYNLLFKSPEGSDSEAQTTAFEDTWTWGDSAEKAFDEVMHSDYSNVSTMLNAMRSFLGESDIMAYLSMMAIRLMELHRVLKPTGTLYLHCDPSASHYLKILMDGIFSASRFRNEISWKRSQPKSHTSVNFPNCRDVILRYSKSDKLTFNKVYGEHDPEYLENFYRFTDTEGRRYRLGDLTNPNKNRPNLTYEFLGVKRVWRWTRERMEEANRNGLIYQSKPGAVPQMKRYLDDMQGQPISDDWDDIEHLHGSAGESLGYPTQKPLALLERIIKASSNEGDVVLDPFCGCGTAVDAAQKLERQWRGIDVTHLAIGLIEKRLNARYPNIRFDVHGMPEDIDGIRQWAKQARQNPRIYHELQYWAINKIPAAQHWQNKKKGADSGIDGIVWLRTGKGKYDKALISVKAGENIGVDMIRDFRGTIEREKAMMGVFCTLYEPKRPMVKEAAAAGIADLNGVKCPRIQITTFEDLLQGKQPQLPYADFAYAMPQAARAAAIQHRLAV